MTLQDLGASAYRRAFRSHERLPPGLLHEDGERRLVPQSDVDLPQLTQDEMNAAEEPRGTLPFK